MCNAAGYSTQCVAELALGLTIACLRQLPVCEAAARGGGAGTPFRGREIAGRTVGIVGTGAIGTRTAQLFQAFGARVIAYSRTRRPEVERLGVTYVSLEELLRKATSSPSTCPAMGRPGVALPPAPGDDETLCHSHQRGSGRHRGQRGLGRGTEPGAAGRGRHRRVRPGAPASPETPCSTPRTRCSPPMWPSPPRRVCSAGRRSSSTISMLFFGGKARECVPVSEGTPVRINNAQSSG